MKNYIVVIILALLTCFNVLSAEKVDTSKNRIRMWKLDHIFSEQIILPIDTNLHQFQIYKPFYKKNLSFSYLGNLGTPGLPNIFDNLKPKEYFVFGKPFQTYIANPADIKYYNTLKPYTEILYTTGDQKSNQEQTFNVLHTQNVNENLNVGLNYKNISSIGQFANQKATSNVFSFFTSYINENISVHGGVNYNKFKIEENGGIANDSIFENTQEDVDLLEVNFGEISTGTTRNPDAWTLFRNRNVFVSTKYHFNVDRNTLSADTIKKDKENSKMKAALHHLLKYEDDYRAFHDKDSIGKTFYENIYIDGKSTNDSAYFRSLSNTFSFHFFNREGNKFKFNGKIGLTSQFLKYSNNIIPDTSIIYNVDQNLDEYNITVVQKGLNDTVITRTKSESFSNTSLWFHLNSEIFNSWAWNISTQYYLGGYEKGNFRINGEIKKYFLSKKAHVSVKGAINEYQPDYFLQHYESNYFAWHNNFNITRERSLKFDILMPDIRFNAGFDYFRIKDMVFIGDKGLPEQYNKPLILFSPYIKKDFEFWKIKMINKLVIQLYDNKRVVSVPKWAIYHSTYFNQFLFKKVLFFQLGYDIRSNSRFYGLSYKPSTGLFYNQFAKKIGEYPLLNVFANVKVKKVRFYVKYENLLSLSLFQLKRDYYSTIHYPIPMGTVRFGLSWIFLN